MTHEEEFVKEIIEYVFAYPDDDYMTMECLCRKLVKYHLMSKVDGYYIADRKTENSSEKPNNCESKICDTCRYYNSNIPCGSTPSACKEADKFAEEFVDGLKKLKPKDEPQTDIHDLTDCDFCKDRNCKDCEGGKDEPQTERHLPDYSYESGIAERLKQAKKPCGKCEYHDWKWDEHIGYVDICKGIGRCPYNVQETITSEPQTDCSWK